MRKLLLKIASILACTFTVGGFIACDASVNPAPTDKPQQQTNALEWVVADFETWQTGMQLIRTGDSFGAIHWNKDTKYIKKGAGSALLHPLGGYRTGKMPLMFFPTSSELFQFDYSDFSAVNTITFEFFNAEETPVNVAVGLLTSLRTTNEWTTTSFDYKALEPQKWTTVTYTVDTSALSISYDVTDIPGIYVAFENVHSREEADAPNIYLDEVVLRKHKVAPEIKDLVKVEGNGYLDFEEAWNEHVINIRNTDCMPSMSIVKASDCLVGSEPIQGQEDTRTPLVAKSGEKVLRLNAPMGANKKTFWPGILFSKALMERSVFGRMDKSDYARVTFSMDIFNNSEATGDERNTLAQRFGITFMNASGNKYIQYAFYVNPYEWYTYTMSMYDLYNDWQAKYPNNTEVFDAPGQVQIVWGEYNEGKEREFFIDNMHFIVEEKDTAVKPTIDVAPFEREVLLGSKVKLPNMEATDVYDLELPVTVAAQYYTESGWEDVALERGEIPIDKVGEYKLIVSAKNSLGNSTVKEYPFRVVDKLTPNLFASYDYADEVDTIYVKDNACERKWHETISIGGQSRNGVVEIKTNNADNYGAGYIGFRFAETIMDKAAEDTWDYISFKMYIDAPVSEMSLCSWQDWLFTSIQTKKWIEIRITKDMLNTGGSYVNGTGSPLSDRAFYNAFEEACGLDGELLFYTNTVKATQGNSQITYYIDEVKWGKNEHGSYGNTDGYHADIYDGWYADPFEK